MMCIYLKNGDCIELEAAAVAERRNGLLIFLDKSGQTVQTIDPAAVDAYTADPDIIDAMKDEICDDVPVTPPD